MKKELGIFIGLFLFLAIGMHFKQWIDHPIEHMMNMKDGGAFGIPGLLHPFAFTFMLYVIIGIPRIIGKIFSKSK